MAGRRSGMGAVSGWTGTQTAPAVSSCGLWEIALPARQTAQFASGPTDSRAALASVQLSALSNGQCPGHLRPAVAEGDNRAKRRRDQKALRKAEKNRKLNIMTGTFTERNWRVCGCTGDDCTGCYIIRTGGPR